MNDSARQLAFFYIRLGRAIHRRSRGYNDQQFQGELCPVCGMSRQLSMHGVLWPELVLQWRLTPAWANWMDQREGLRCTHCRSNLRSRQLAKCIVEAMNNRLGTAAETLAQLCGAPEIQPLVVAEINAAGNLHPYLERLRGLKYSEYGSTEPRIASEDLMSLSYADGVFDLVINSDVLEHVPDIERALAEVHRVLKPEGVFVFSVPVVWNQAMSRRRAEIRDGQLIHCLPPSHHGAESAGKDDFLVFHELGRDFVGVCERIGFAVELVKDRRNPAVVTFVAERR